MAGAYQDRESESQLHQVHRKTPIHLNYFDDWLIVDIEYAPGILPTAGVHFLHHHTDQWWVCGRQRAWKAESLVFFSSSCLQSHAYREKTRWKCAHLRYLLSMEGMGAGCQSTIIGETYTPYHTKAELSEMPVLPCVWGVCEAAQI